jgi:hypothetical protein
MFIPVWKFSYCGHGISFFETKIVKQKSTVAELDNATYKKNACLWKRTHRTGSWSKRKEVIVV